MFSRGRGAWAIALGLLFVAGALLLSRAGPTASAARPEDGTRAVPASPAAGAAQVAAVLTPFDEWIALYEDASLAQIQEELEALRRYLFAETNAYYEARFLAGDYEIVTARNPDGSIPMVIGDDLAAWRYLPSREVAKVTLPREGFENAYEAKLRTEFLLDKAKEREEFEAKLAGAK